MKNNFIKVLFFFILVSVSIFIYFAFFDRFEEDYCYNQAFVIAKQKGIKIAEVPKEYKQKGYTNPIQIRNRPGVEEWWEFRKQCFKSFHYLSAFRETCRLGLKGITCTMPYGRSPLPG